MICQRFLSVSESNSYIGQDSHILQASSHLEITLHFRFLVDHSVSSSFTTCPLFGRLRVVLPREYSGWMDLVCLGVINWIKVLSTKNRNTFQLFPNSGSLCSLTLPHVLQTLFQSTVSPINTPMPLFPPSFVFSPFPLLLLSNFSQRPSASRRPQIIQVRRALHCARIARGRVSAPWIWENYGNLREQRIESNCPSSFATENESPHKFDVNMCFDCFWQRPESGRLEETAAA
ncbi:hypothetical protein L596_008102 [Steinernema carpocapsae]|uniref:Uncharacterized protein n=1 Tax=Steinernema carpocapsae TaxID=34508 RepID=A0A4U5PBI7_STECR|nr:hypothetical protein L596_008102 [Steinernema carpocapsae]